MSETLKELLQALNLVYIPLFYTAIKIAVKIEHRLTEVETTVKNHCAKSHGEG